VSPLRGTTVTMSRLRKVIAARMVESLQVSAQLTTVIEVDVTKIARLRDKAKASFEAREGVKLSFLPFFAVATCEALKQHPVLNSSVEGDQIIYHGAEHLGIAVDTERGLLVPVIHSAGDLNMGGIARKIADLAARTRDNKVTPDELGGGTFTLTNTGSRGALDSPSPSAEEKACGGWGLGVVGHRRGAPPHQPRSQFQTLALEKQPAKGAAGHFPGPGGQNNRTSRAGLKTAREKDAAWRGGRCEWALRWSVFFEAAQCLGRVCSRVTHRAPP
jgi:hypothetical protein